MSLPFGLTPLPQRPTSFHPRSPSPTSFPTSFHNPSNITPSPSPTTRSPSPSTSSIRSIRSLQSILYHPHRRPSTTSVIPSARSSMFGEEVESEDVAVMGVMEPRPDEGGRERWGGIGEVLGMGGW